MTVTSPAVFLQNGSYGASPIRRALASIIRPGIISAGDLAVSQNGTPNMSVNIATGAAWVPGTELPASQGYYFFENITAVLNKSVAASDPTNGRRDLVVARIKDQEFSGLLNTADIEVVTGTPAASPADPTVPANCWVLARLTVAAGVTTIVTGNITDLRTSYPTQTRSAALGGFIPILSSNPPTSGLYPGLPLWATDAKGLYVYNGTTFDLVTTVPTAWVAPTLLNSWANFGAPHQVAQYRKIGDMVYCRGLIRLGTFGSAAFTLPAGFRPPASVIFTSADNATPGEVTVDVSGNVIPTATNNTYQSLNGIIFSIS
jgi:hypothetical protein